MGTYIIRRRTSANISSSRLFSKYDDTDALKRMKDSDILAEKKKQPSTKRGTVLAGTIAGAGLGMAGGSLLHAASGKYKGLGFRRGMQHAGRRLKVGGKYGALIGAGIGLAALSGKRTKEKIDNEFYNDRLEYAQRQARRREKADWKGNMTTRDGYSY